MNSGTHVTDSIATTVALLAIFYVYAGDVPPAVNEAHYLVKAKNFWDPSYLANDMFAASGKAHATFYALFGWPTQFVSLTTTAWIGRIVGWTLIAIGLVRLATTITGRPLAALPIAVLWIVGIRHGNLAGEWVVGGMEAKVPAYGLVLIGMSDLCRGRWRRVWIWFGAASAIHVLTGGWSVVAAMVAWFATRRQHPHIEPLFTRHLWIGGLIALAGVIPALRMNADGSGQSSIASMIYVYDRIPHHLLPANFEASWYLRHALIVAGCLVCIARCRVRSPRWQRLANWTIGVIAIEATGILIGCLPPVAPQFAASLLRFYWFRLSDAMLPLTTALVVVSLVGSIRPRDRAAHTIGIAIMGVGAIAFVTACTDNIRGRVPVSVQNRLLGWRADASADELDQTWRDWRAVCRWAHDSSPPDTLFLTPRHQQSFKWYASRPEVVNWKDVPQDAASLIEWKRRMQDIYPASLANIKVTINYNKLRQYRRDYGAQYMIVDHRVVPAPIPLQKIYPLDPTHNQTYAIYDLPQE